MFIMVLLDNGSGDPQGLHIAPPPAGLESLVEHTFVQTHTGGEWRVVPDTSPHLIAVITESPSGRRLRACMVGPRSRMALVDHRSRIVTVGVRLTAGAIPAILPESADQFLDRAVPLGETFPRRVLADLELHAAASPALLVSELLRVVRRAARASEPGPMAASLARVARVRGMAEMLAAPERTVRDRAHREIGLSPKRAIRIMRLHQALWTARPRALSWAAVAHATGYADQAHLTRECRSLLGDTPCQWFARGSADLFKTGGRTP